jgi:PKD repeat protein
MWGAILDTNYITAYKNTPSILIQGTEDDIVPYTSGYPFQLPVFPVVYGAVPIHARMNAVGLQNELVPLVGYSHEPELLYPQLNDTIYNYSRRFLFPLFLPGTSAIRGDSIVCLKSPAYYSVVNTPGSSYCWQLNGNGTIVQNSNSAIAVMWNDTGHVSVSVSELNNIDASGPVKIFQTYVSSVPDASFTCNIDQLEVAILNHSSGAATYFWNFGNDSTSDFLNPVVAYASGGTYHITLIADNSFCADTFSSTITIDSCPHAYFTYAQSGMNAFFYADTTYTSAYNWNFGDGDSASIPSTGIFHQYTAGGTFMVVLRVENELKCSSADTVFITFSDAGINPVANNDIQAFCDLNTGCRLVLSPAEIYTVEVFDISGRSILKTDVSGNYFLSTQSLTPGVYLLKIESANQIFTKKFVKME